MDQEARIADLNQDFFLREFTYSGTKFRSQSGQELELCDGAIWIDDLLILIQAKVRNASDATACFETEGKWFTRKVEKNAVKQIGDSLRYLATEMKLPMQNHRGQLLDFKKAEPSTIHKVVVYTPSPKIAARKFLKKGRVSSKSGFVHFIREGDYQAICVTLMTPAEISQYLNFRADYVQRDPNANKVSEKALVGKYLTDSDDTADVCDEHEFVTDRLINDPEEYSVSKLLWGYLDQLQAYEGPNASLQYHKILSILAMMKRNVMREFKKRLRWAMEKAASNEACLPTRMFPFHMGCSFIFISLEQIEPETRVAFLERYAMLSKQDLKSERCLAVGVSRRQDNSNSFLVHWIVFDHPWAPDSELDGYLAKNPDCFNPIREAELGLYQLK